MTEFSTHQAFQIFRRQELQEYRYVLDDDSQSFLKSVLATSRKREASNMIPNGLYRWRINKQRALCVALMLSRLHGSILLISQAIVEE